MRYSEDRPILLKGIHEQDHDNPATPRWISPLASGFLIAKELGVTLPTPKQNRRGRRAAGVRRIRRRLPGLAIPKSRQPWRVK
ncbi:hypothetical protein PBI_LUCKY2013_167 [Mycobacterium phage Lucky2013]|nr:hypothetical protein PORCELAIN_171 [Mycobacterium phage Porcelain]ASD53560.1 hypothetical protein PBI_LUCKY2013_167 [Mycobacterium phage Lucky2013]